MVCLMLEYNSDSCQGQMSSVRNSKKHMDSLYYSLEQDLPEDHPQYRYFKLYEKYTSEVCDPYLHQQEPNYSRSPPNLRQQSEERSNIIRERAAALQKENALLRKEVSEQRDLIERLKYQLYYCNTQIQQITKIESVEYQQALEDLRQEIEEMLEKTKNSEAASIEQYRRSLRPALDDNYKEYKVAAMPFKQRQTYLQYESKQNNGKYCNKPSVHTPKQEDDTHYQFLNNLKDMYGKITGGNAKSLKELWKWLKDLAQIASRMKKWGKRYRQLAKTALQLPSETLIKLLDEALIIIN